MWVYLKCGNKVPIWTVGFYLPQGDWTAVKDHTTEEEAMRWVNYLNGGTGEPLP